MVGTVDLSTSFSFSLQELAKARVLSYMLDTTGYLNPDLNLHKDLESLKNLEGTYVITSAHKEVTKGDKTELTREEWLALGNRPHVLQTGKIIRVVVDQLGGEEATWRVDWSGGSLPFPFEVCHYEQRITNARLTCGIEGRAMVTKLWRKTKVDEDEDEVSGSERMKDATGEEVDLLHQVNIWIDKEGSLRLKIILPNCEDRCNGKLIIVTRMFIARRI